MKITDKMIKDVLYRSGCVSDYAIPVIKENLKDDGYEVEEEKTTLEEAREYKLNEFKVRTSTKADEWLCDFGLVVRKINLYEKVIEENEKYKFQLHKKLSAGRDYLMTVNLLDITVDDCLESFGFTKDGFMKIK